MIERLTSGKLRLDEVLGGGFPVHAINLIAGPPGTGKTLLAQQYLFENATTERPGLYLTTTSEPLDKVIRYGQGLDFFDRSAIGTSVLYESLASQLVGDGLAGVSERLLELVRDVRPGIVVIDSFKAFGPYAKDPLEFRSFVAELAGRLSPLPINTFWVGEYGLAELPDLPEAAVADAILVLRSVASGQRTARYLQILKLRGGQFLSGEHAYRLSSAGLQVFPRLADPVVESTASADVQRLSTGISGLDQMLGGGVFHGATTLIIGPSGTGKTILSLEFLTAGARRGSRGVFASLQENPTQMARILEGGRGRELDDQVEIHRRSPVDVYIDEWVYEVFERVESTGAELLAIDSLTDLRIASPDPKRFEEYSYSLTQRLGQLGITTVMTMESPPSLGFADLPSSVISHLADNIIILGYQLSGSTVGRGIHVLKARASRHDPVIREFTIGPDHITIGEPLDLPPGSLLMRPASPGR
jgi:circadian clock protein KaiC